jgi:hypothetical protein
MINKKNNFSYYKSHIPSISMKIVIIATLIIAYLNQEWLWVIGSIAGLFIGYIPSILKHDINITLPWSIEILFVSVLALHMGGVLLNAYYNIQGFSQITHFLTSILVAFLVFAIIYIIDKYWDGLNMDRNAMGFVVIVTTMAAGVILEFIKYFYIFGKKQFSVEEVLLSLLITTISGIIIAMIGVNLIKEGKFDDITNGLVDTVDSTIITQIKKMEKNREK